MVRFQNDASASRDSQLARSQSCGEAKPRLSSQSISSQVAMPSFSQMSRQPCTETASPNHWCASSWATSQSCPGPPTYG